MSALEDKQCHIRAPGSFVGKNKLNRLPKNTRTNNELTRVIKRSLLIIFQSGEHTLREREVRVCACTFYKHIAYKNIDIYSHAVKLTDPTQNINQRLHGKTQYLLSQMKSGERCRKVGGPKSHDRCLLSFLSCTARRCYGNTSNPVLENAVDARGRSAQLFYSCMTARAHHRRIKHSLKSHSCSSLQELLFVFSRF